MRSRSLRSTAAVVLDADALSVFQDDPEALFQAIAGRAAATVLTPHDGEFGRLFPDLAKEPDKVARARAAAKRAARSSSSRAPTRSSPRPEARPASTPPRSPFLATAGTGDVLAGMILGLLAQDMDAFVAAAAAVWMHGEAGRLIGPGLISRGSARMRCPP